MGEVRLENYHRFMNIIDFLFGLFSKNEMQIEVKHDLRVSVAGQLQKQSVQVSQGTCCFFKSGKAETK
jgi:hypothetical protein